MNIDDITTDPSKLTNLKDIKVKENLPKTERIIDYIIQAGGNPYFYRYGKRTVKISFSDTDVTCNEIYESILMSK